MFHPSRPTQPQTIREIHKAINIANVDEENVPDPPTSYASLSLVHKASSTISNHFYTISLPPLYISPYQKAI